MKISLSEFAGMAPKLAPTALAADLAQESSDACFDEGLLTGALVSTVASADFATVPSTTKSIAKPTASPARLAFSWASKGGAFASLLAPLDTWGRVYYLRYDTNTAKYRAVYSTKDNYSASVVTVDPTHYTLGMPAPVTAATIVGMDVDKSAYGDTEVELDTQITGYVYTIVDAYGHEGVPSAPSTVVKLPYDAPFRVDLSFTPQSISGANMDGGLRRLYRAAFDGSSSAWQFVADIPWYELTYADHAPLGTEAESLVSTDWAAPPMVEDLAIVNGAFLAAFSGNLLLLSEYMLPHAWPEAYRFPLPHQIVAIKATLGGLFIGTKGSPFWASGTDPSAASPVDLGTNAPCLSAASVVDMGGFVIYASSDGLVSVEAAGATVITAEFIDRMRWLRDFSPGSMKAFGHEGEYYFSVAAEWWVFTPLGGRGLRKVNFADVWPATLRQVWYDAERDTTLLLRNDGKVFDVASAQAEAVDFHWVSKDHRTSPVMFSTGQVVSSVYPVTLEVTADGRTHDYAVNNGQPFRLRATGQHTHWALGIRAKAAARVASMTICQSPRELIE